jgi:hypothetical protein
MKAHITDQCVTQGFPTAGSETRSRKVPDGPPDKRGPGSVGAEHGAKQKNSRSLSHKHTTKRPPKSQELDRNLAVYDGVVRVATITVTGGEFIVVLPDGTLLGRFKTLTQASAAIPTAQGGAVADQIGTMIARPGAVDAFDMHGIHLGRFKSLRAARSAIEISTKSLRAARSAKAHELGLLDDTAVNINSRDGGGL